jgi:hypothetical protein
MIETVPTVSPKTIGFKLSGKLHDEDYKSFMPTVESFLAGEGKARLFVQFEDFHGWDLHAVWDDTKFAFKHYADFDRIAMVGVFGEGRGEVDDPTGVPQAGDRLLGHEERAFDVHSHEFIENFLGCSFDGSLLADPGVVDQDIELGTAMSLGQFSIESLEEMPNSGHRADIALDGKSFTARRFDFPDHGGSGLCIFLIVDGHFRPVLGKAESTKTSSKSWGV